jgi:hypothetical protein
MNMSSIPSRSIKTDCLLLRPTRGSDAGRAFEIQVDCEVMPMLSLASAPFLPRVSDQARADDRNGSGQTEKSLAGGADLFPVNP